LNRRNQNAFEHAKGSGGYATKTLHYRFTSPADEPMWWVSDALARAVRAAVGSSHNTAFLERFGAHRVLIVESAP
jgi:hypothetical protein